MSNLFFAGSTLNWPMTEIEAELNALGPDPTQERQNEIHIGEFDEAGLATRSQAIPALHASDTNSGAPLFISGVRVNYLLAKKKPRAVC